MIVKVDEDNFSIKLYRDFVKGKLVGLMEVIPIDELLEVWEKHKAEPTISKMEQVEKQKCPFDDPIPCEWVCTEYGKCKYKDEPQTDYDKGLQQLREIMFDKEKTEQLLKECEAMGIKTDCPWR